MVIAAERAPTMATTIQRICRGVGQPGEPPAYRAASSAAVSANGSANSECSNFIISSTVRVLLAAILGRKTKHRGRRETENTERKLKSHLFQSLSPGSPFLRGFGDHSSSVCFTFTADLVLMLEPRYASCALPLPWPLHWYCFSCGRPSCASTRHTYCSTRSSDRKSTRLNSSHS